MIAGKACFLAGVVASLGFGWFAFPRVLYQRSEQPLQFSHKVHATTAAMKCEDCHSVLADGRFSAIPPLAKCAECHSAAIGTTKEEKLLVERYVTPGREIPWHIYAGQPDNVFFPHANHLKLGKVDCGRCHGDHGKTDTLRAYEYDPITGYSRDIGEPKFLRAGAYRTRSAMKMDDCAQCHHEKKVETACLDCHK
jgi:hypothetical protein